MTVKNLYDLQPGDKLVRIQERKLKGPRGGRYVFGGEAINKTFASRTLSADGRSHRLTFADGAPLVIPANVGRFARFEVA